MILGFEEWWQAIGLALAESVTQVPSQIDAMKELARRSFEQGCRVGMGQEDDPAIR